MQQFLDSLQLTGVWDEIVNLVRHPNSNLLAASLLLLAVVIFVLLVASIVVAIISPSRRRQEIDPEELAYYLSILEATDAEDEGEAVAEEPVERPAPAVIAVEPERRPLLQRALLFLASVVGITVLLALAVGATTSSSAACLGCHETTPHSEVVDAGGVDPHESTACVGCHEGSGVVGMVTVETGDRLVHYFNGLRQEPEPDGYGAVVSSACYRCHNAVRTAITEDEVRGVKMSHREPLEAGAECDDCHANGSGVVSKVANGMAPCLRCHDGESARTECTTCHTKDVSAATRSRKSVASMNGRVLIPTPDCGGCHVQETQCDPCHGGVRMPHSETFRWWGHAREGVKDVWFNDGEKCSRCHTEQRRPCTECHSNMPGHPVTPWVTIHGSGGSGQACDSCHGRRAYVTGRDFCELCHGEVITQ